MKIITKEEMYDYPKGTVFADYYPDMGLELSQIQIKDDYEFGACSLIPSEDGEIFDWDWNLNEYRDTDKFWIFEEKEINNMIHLLMRGWYYNNEI